MNHKATHDRIIDRAKNRIWPEGEYGERHHILPKCCGGDNSEENLVKLFPEEHWVVHLLLIKIYDSFNHPKENWKLRLALRYLSHRAPQLSGRKNKLYGMARRMFIEGVKVTGRNNKGKKQNLTEAQREGYSERARRRFKGVPKTKEHVEKTAEKKRGSKDSLETRERKSRAQKQRFEDPKARQERSEIGKKRYEDPQEREKSSKATKKAFEDPAKRQKLVKGQERRWAKPEEREKARAGQLKRIENPEEKAKRNKNLEMGKTRESREKAAKTLRENTAAKKEFRILLSTYGI